MPDYSRAALDYTCADHTGAAFADAANSITSTCANAAAFADRDASPFANAEPFAAPDADARAARTVCHRLWESQCLFYFPGTG